MFLIDEPCNKRLIEEKSGNVGIQVSVWNLIGLDKSFLCHSSRVEFGLQPFPAVTGAGQQFITGPTYRDKQPHALTLTDNSALIADTNLPNLHPKFGS